MTDLQVSDELAQTIQHEAHERGLSVEHFLRQVLVRERTLADRQKIQLEQTWWLSQPLSLRAQYEGQFVAVHERQLVDSDKDEATLLKRIRQRFGRQTAVLVMPAEGPTEIRVVSPRLASA